jgi:hypothetical protein
MMTRYGFLQKAISIYDPIVFYACKANVYHHIPQVISLYVLMCKVYYLKILCTRGFGQATLCVQHELN